MTWSSSINQNCTHDVPFHIADMTTLVVTTAFVAGEIATNPLPANVPESVSVTLFAFAPVNRTIWPIQTPGIRFGVVVNTCVPSGIGTTVSASVGNHSSADATAFDVRVGAVLNCRQAIVSVTTLWCVLTPSGGKYAPTVTVTFEQINKSAVESRAVRENRIPFVTELTNVTFLNRGVVSRFSGVCHTAFVHAMELCRLHTSLA